MEKRASKAALLTGLLFFLMRVGVFGHPDLQEQIAALTLQLEKEPANANLWLRRSDVRRQHGQFEAALKDLAAAERLQPRWPLIALARARTLFDAGRTTEALRQVDQFLKTESGHAEALVLRARCWVTLGQVEKAIAAYTAALGRLAEPSPDLFLERARLLASAGRLQDAIKGLDDGTNRLGPAPALELVAIEYERQQGNFDTALARVDRLVARSSVKESALTLQAEVLEQAGRLAEARVVFEQALRGIEKYPANRRGIEATRQLQKRAGDGLARLRAKVSRLAASLPYSSPGARTGPTP